MHSEWSIRALEAGKHVLCEKPFSRHIGDVEAAFDAAERTGLHLSEAFMYRHHPQTARLAELVSSGAIGELRVIRTAFSYSLYDAENIRLRTDVEGGSLMDVGCYCVSGARLLGGEPESVVGAAHIGSSGTDWVFTGMMRFPGDVTALFDCGTSLPNRDELEAIGTEGSLFLDDPWHCKSPVIELRRDGAVERIEVEAANPYRLELEDMNAAIRGERRPLLGRADALGQVRAIDALFRSAAEESGRGALTPGQPPGGYPRDREASTYETEENDEADCPHSGARYGARCSTAGRRRQRPVFKGTVGPGFTISMASKPTGGRQDEARDQRQGGYPQLPPHGAGSERQDERSRRGDRRRSR